MNGYVFPITCPLCSGRLESVRVGVPSSWSTCAVVGCSECRAEFTVTVSVLLNKRRPRVTEARIEQLKQARSMRVSA